MPPALRRLSLTGLLVLVVGLSSCAPVAKTLVELNRDFTKPACFETAAVTGYAMHADDFLEVQAGADSYIVKLADHCPQLRETGQLAFGNLIGKRVCGTLGEAIYLQGGGRCSIDRVMKKSESEINIAGNS
jgi:hypothetical protein